MRFAASSWIAITCRFVAESRRDLVSLACVSAIFLSLSILAAPLSFSRCRRASSFSSAASRAASVSLMICALAWNASRSDTMPAARLASRMRSALA